MQYLLQCDSLCRSKNIFFQVVMLPYRSQLADESMNRTPQTMVNKFCERNSVSFSDASPFIAKQSDINSLYLFADEIHFSRKGHRAIAKFLSE
jgi:lysophospholipase L1-like esterase